MTKTELLNKLARTEDDRLLLARALDKLEAGRNRAVPTLTHFLSQAEGALVAGLIAASGHPRHLFFGGFEGAERTVCAFLPDWLEEDDWLAQPPLAAFQITAPADSGLTHRDYLGAILGLGFSREKLGDLLVEGNVCQAVTLEETAPLILAQLDQVGRWPVKTKPLALGDLIPAPKQVQVARDTFSSLRLDAVASSAFGLPRTKAASLISSGRVTLNHTECTKPDRLLVEGDVLTCRGYGRCILARITGTSKKGRVMVELEKYV